MTLRLPSSVIVDAKIIPRQKPAPYTTASSTSHSKLFESPLASTDRAMGSSNTSSPAAAPEFVSVPRPEEPQADPGQRNNELLDAAMGPTEEENPVLEPILVLEDQRRDINRIFEAIDNLQDEMSSIKNSIQNLQDRPSETFAGEIELLTENVSKVSKGMGEIEGLKFEIKMMQQRLKRLEEANSHRRTFSGTVDTRDSSRETTPIASRYLSPYLTPRNQHGPSREDTTVGRDVGSRLLSRGFSERLAGSHPLRNVEHIFDRPPSWDGNHVPSEGLQLSNTLLPSGNADRAANEMQRSNATAAPDHSKSYTDQRLKSSDPLPNVANGQIETSHRNALSAHNMQSLATGVNSNAVSEAQPRPETSVHDIEYPMQENEEVEVISGQPQLRAPQGSVIANNKPPMPAPSAVMVPDTQERHQTPVRALAEAATPVVGKHRERITAPDTETGHGRTKRRKTTAFDETIPPRTSTESPDRSIWAADAPSVRRLSGENRNEQGLLLRRNGKVDGRSTRYLNHEKDKRSHRPAQGPRDAEGYLLRPDGSRDTRSVRIINSAKKNKRVEIGQAGVAVPIDLQLLS